LKVFATYGDTHYLSRRLISSPEGEVFSETFYDLNENPITTIHRSDFQLFRSKSSQYQMEIRFPHQIKIETSDPRDGQVKKTHIQFDRVGFFQTSSHQEDNFHIPPETEIVYINDSMG